MKGCRQTYRTAYNEVDDEDADGAGEVKGDGADDDAEEAADDDDDDDVADNDDDY